MISMVYELHKTFNIQKRYYFPFDNLKNEIPKNGIYVIFEKGEKYKQFDRIVRIGTHTGNNQLYSRLKQHYIKENKNRSIFRKNIGRCFLNQEGDPYLEIWNLDSTLKDKKELYSKVIDKDYEMEIEKRITEYIQNHFSFVAFPVEDKTSRLFWESKIASTLAQSKEIQPSPNWLGHYSPKEKIRESGLWQVNGLGGDCINEMELIELNKLLFPQ